jgi:hypothetical protein
MTIEALIAAHTEAVNANTEALKANTAALLAGAAPAKATTPAKTEDKPKTAKEKTAEAAAQMMAEDAAKKNADKPKGTTTKKAATLEDVTKAFSDYLSAADDDEDELATRRENVKAINNHFGVSKLRELDPANFAEALKHLKAFVDGGKPEFMSEDGGEGDEDDLV